MKLSEWAEKNSYSYRRAWQLFKEGKIENARQMPTGKIIIDEPVITVRDKKVAVYARVSSAENKSNLQSQSERMVTYCNANGWKVDKVVTEIGSGLNDNRKKLIGLLADDSITQKWRMLPRFNREMRSAGLILSFGLQCIF